MVVDVTKAKNFLLDTDFPLDKIIYLKSDVYNYPSGGGLLTIPHNLPFTPLVGGSWALNASFSVIYEYSAGTFPSPNLDFVFGIQTNVTSDETNVYINVTVATATAGSVYYRVFGFEPNTSNADLLPLASAGDNFVINTDYNYLKLYMNNSFPYTANSTYTILHNLGYYPQVLAWYDAGGQNNPINYGDNQPNGAITDLQVTTTSLIFSSPDFGSGNIYYRVYLDE